MDSGDRIRAARSARGLSQSRLAELSGVAAVSIRSYETHKRFPKLDQIKKLAAALEVSAEYLLGNTDEPDPPAGKTPWYAAFSDGELAALGEERDRLLSHALYGDGEADAALLDEVRRYARYLRREEWPRRAGAETEDEAR